MKGTWSLPGEGKLKPLHQDDQTNILFAVELKIPQVFIEKPQILSQFSQALPQGKVKSYQWLTICPRSQNIDMMDSKSRRTFFTVT